MIEKQLPASHSFCPLANSLIESYIPYHYVLRRSLQQPLAENRKGLTQIGRSRAPPINCASLLGNGRRGGASKNALIILLSRL